MTSYAELAKDDFSFPKRILRILKKYGVDVYFVHLSCDKRELYKRVISKSRKKFRKTKNVGELNFLLYTKNYKKVFPASKMIRTNTSKISPSDAAKEILSQISRN